MYVSPNIFMHSEAKKQGCVMIRPGAIIRTNTVLYLQKISDYQNITCD